MTGERRYDNNVDVVNGSRSYSRFSIMIAIVKSGGKQYYVKPGDVIKVEKLEVEPESIISLTDVLLTVPDDGSISISKEGNNRVAVTAEVLKHVRNRKVIIFKKRGRHNSRRKNGHRQWMTVLKVTEISSVANAENK